VDQERDNVYSTNTFNQTSIH